jgi:Asp-tRNA(Asn)/Glu-tRNA(Gln) amidotransferase A subunit family amidase
VVAHRLHAATRRLQPIYVPFVDVIDAEVLAQASASAARWKSASGPLSILDGVPVAVKDMIDTRGHLTSDGSASNQANAKAKADDQLVARFRELGAIILGTTVMTEGGVTPLGYSVQYQGPFNPWSVNHYSGGSSGGSAVAVALGLCPIAVGFDGGGSIRIPAGFSGVVGLATSYGRVDFSSTRAISNVKAGPLAATAGDAAIAFAAMARPPPDTRHAHFDRMYAGGGVGGGRPTAHLGGFAAAADLSQVRLGLFKSHFDDTSPGTDVHAVTSAAVAKLVAAGATVVPIEIPSLGWLRLAHAIKISTEFASGWDTKYSDWADLEPNTRITIGLGMTVTAVEALACDKIRAWAFDYMVRLFAEHNLTAIVSPTLPMSAPEFPPGAREFGESNTGFVVEIMKYINLANFVGLPALSVPVGADTTNNGMPIGLHFMGPHWSEHDLLRLARAVELTVPPIGTPPAFFDVFAAN